MKKTTTSILSIALITGLLLYSLAGFSRERPRSRQEVCQPVQAFTCYAAMREEAYGDPLGEARAIFAQALGGRSAQERGYNGLQLTQQSDPVPGMAVLAVYEPGNCQGTAGRTSPLSGAETSQICAAFLH